MNSNIKLAFTLVYDCIKGLFKHLVRVPLLGVMKGLYLFVSIPSVIFLLTLTAMVFRHPDVQMPQIDRFSFALLLLSAVGYCLFKRSRLLFVEPIVFYMVSLTAIALVSTLVSPFVSHDAQTWSSFSNKFFVPFTMFYLAKMVFDNERVVKYFFLFALIITVYLIFISIATVMNIEFLVIPRYILDPSLGPPEHVVRARGPFLSAAPNGMAIIILGFTALHWFQKKETNLSFTSLFIIFGTISIFATMTRAIWLSFVVSVVIFFLNTRNARFRKAMVPLIFISLVSIILVLEFTGKAKLVSDRFHDNQNIVFRENLYVAGFKMFTERPLLGWGINGTPSLLPGFLQDYEDNVYVHNSYLEILIEHGIVGLILYILIFLHCFKIGGHIYRSTRRDQTVLIDAKFVLLWRIFLGVYLINGMFAVMNYQFINALIFTVAGIVSAAETRIAERARIGTT